MYGFAPRRRCSSTVARPPVNAFMIFFWALASVSVVQMLDSGIEADILPVGPRRLGRSLLCIIGEIFYTSLQAAPAFLPTVEAGRGAPPPLPPRRHQGPPFPGAPDDGPAPRASPPRPPPHQ